MKTISRYVRTAVFAAVAGGMIGVAVADPLSPPPAYTPTAEEIAAEEARRAADDFLSSVVENRDAVIDELVAAWQPEIADRGWEVDAWADEFAAILEQTSDLKLADVLGAESYEAVQSILQGGSGQTLPDGVSGVETLGSTSQDLVFTSVTPCRIFDTRYDWDGAAYPPAGSPGSIFSYYVYGSAGTLYAQGHNQGVNSGPGCASPRGEPSGIAANFTVASPLGNGHIRAWPYGASQPTASFLNYVSGANLANAGIVATCYGCARDLNVSTWYNRAHSLADVMGYFYYVNPVEVEDQVRYSDTTNSVGVSTSCSTLNTVYVYIPRKGYVTLTGVGQYWMYKNGNGYYYLKQFIQPSSETACAANSTNFAREALGYYSTGATGGNYEHRAITQTRTDYYSTGDSKYYYLRAQKDSGVTVANKERSSLRAVFHPQIP